MASGFASLNDEQKAGFRANMQRLGLKEDALSHDGVLDTGARSGPTILSTNPADSHIAPTLIPVQNIVEFAQLFGVPDSHYTEKNYSDRAIAYPPPVPAERHAMLSRAADPLELRNQMSAEELKNLKMASEAYVLGNSEKVKSYEPLLNASLFPGHVAAFALDTIVVKPGSPLVLTSDDPNKTMVVCAASITVQPGGQIQVNCKAEIHTQTFTAVS